MSHRIITRPHKGSFGVGISRRVWKMVPMKRFWLLAAMVVSSSSPVWAQTPWDLAKKVGGNAAVSKLEKEINQRLLAESRQNQCSFKTDSTDLMPGCDKKLKTLANGLI